MSGSADNPHLRIFGTFGIYRYCLAALVVATHAAPDTWWFAGRYAVFGFYVLSAYVVCYILDTRYLNLPRGLWKYATNRALRIFPMYYAVFIPSYFLVRSYAHEGEKIALIGVPDGVHGWIANLTTFGISHPLYGLVQEPAVIPMAWSLAVEMTFWALMPTLVRSASWRWIMGWFVCVYSAVVFANALSIPNSVMSDAVGLGMRYFSMLAAALPFFIGLLLYLRKRDGKLHVPRKLGIAAMAALPLVVAVSPLVFHSAVSGGFYIAFAVNIIIIAYLAGVDTKALPAWVQSLDEFLGNIAYPLYLVHISMELVIRVWFPSIEIFSPANYIVCLLASTVAAWLLYCAVDVPVERLKRRFRH